MSRIFRYILVHDHGIAPCPTDGLITLATCKPKIRQKAASGDWVLGFRRGSLERGLLLWGGRVKQVMTHGEYERIYRGRPDALYHEREDGAFDRIDPYYHPTEAEKTRDLSGPVLIFDPEASRYLDGHPIPLPDHLLHLSGMGRGHLVNGVLDGDYERLEAWFESAEISRGKRTRRSVGDKSTRRRC